MNTALRQSGAQFYEWGANVLVLKSTGPCPYKSPAHSWKMYQRRRQTAEEVESLPWARSDISGVGVICGAPGGWRNIDIDDCTAFGPVQRILDALHLPHTYRWVVKTGSGRGWQLWIRCPDALPADLLSEKRGEPGVRTGHPRDGLPFDHLELRWERCQSVLPGSAHPSGGTYTWFNSEPSGPPAEVSVERVVAAIRAVCRTSTEQHGTAGAINGRSILAGAPPALSERLVAQAIVKAKLKGGDIRGRNDAGLWLACQMRDNGFTHDQALDIGKAGFVSVVAHDKPDDEYTVAEYESSVEQAYSKPPRQPWTSSQRAGGPAARTRSDVSDDLGFMPAPLKRFKAELDEAALIGLPGDIIRGLRKYTEASDAALLSHLLTAYGVAIGDTAHMAVGTSLQPARLFALLVGPTGRGRKGTAWEAISFLLRRACPDLLARTRSNIQSGEALIELVRDGTGEDDPGIVDKRLFLLETEFANVLQVRNRKASILTGVLRQAWDSGDLHNSTKNPTSATGAHVAVAGHITRAELRRCTSDTDAFNGFLNRFLFLYVERARKLPLPEPMPDAEANRLVRRLQRAVAHGQACRRMDFTPKARALYETLYEHLEPLDEGLLAALQVRAAPYVLRLALHYALMDEATGIDVVHLRAAVAVWVYSIASLRHIFGTRTGNVMADRILRETRARGEMTRTEIRDLFNRRKSAAEINEALDILYHSGSVRCEKRDTDGRPVEVWRPYDQSDISDRRGNDGDLLSLMSLWSKARAEHNGKPQESTIGQSVVKAGVRVMTEAGRGKTLQVFSDRVAVQVDGEDRLRFFEPDEVHPER